MQHCSSDSPVASLIIFCVDIDNHAENDGKPSAWQPTDITNPFLLSFWLHETFFRSVFFINMCMVNFSSYGFVDLKNITYPFPSLLSLYQFSWTCISGSYHQIHVKLQIRPSLLSIILYLGCVFLLKKHLLSKWIFRMLSICKDSTYPSSHSCQFSCVAS